MPSSLFPLLTPPTVARLIGVTPWWAWELARRGKLGPVKRIGRVNYLHTAEIERYCGTLFSDAQIERALIPPNSSGPHNP